jgi:hypothetical protein
MAQAIAAADVLLRARNHRIRFEKPFTGLHTSQPLESACQRLSRGAGQIELFALKMALSAAPPVV